MAAACSDATALKSDDAETGGVSERSLQWAAGFIDGEGFASKQRPSRRRNASFRLCVSVSENDLAVPEHLRDRIGIAEPIHKVNRSPQHRRQCYTVNYSGPNSMRLIGMLEPHLVRKRREARVARAFCTFGRINERTGGVADAPVVEIREHYFNELKRLK